MGDENASRLKKPSAIYGRRAWNAGLVVARHLPLPLARGTARMGTALYHAIHTRRRRVVFENLLPVFNDDTAQARTATRQLFLNFGAKVADLLRYEAGHSVAPRFAEMSGWEAFDDARKSGGVLLVTPHLGNWELGAPLMAKRGVQFVAVTQAEPGRDFTELRRAARQRWGIETVVIGDDPFSFVEIIRRLQDGATIALLADRPRLSSSVEVTLFGRPFRASIAPAQLARASGCAVFCIYIVEVNGRYVARALPRLEYDRRALGDNAERHRFTQGMMSAFEPAIREYADQWYHFVPVWP